MRRYRRRNNDTMIKFFTDIGFVVLMVCMVSLAVDAVKKGIANPYGGEPKINQLDRLVQEFNNER